jgi:hypothetical protein
MVEEEIKAQEQSLALTQKVLSKREFLSSVVISSAVANAMALVKNHMSKFDTEILQKDFTVDEVTQYFVSLYDSGCNKLVLSYKNFILLHT